MTALPHATPYRRLARLVAAAALACALGGCSPLRVVSAASPSEHYLRTANLAYGAHPRQRLDLYRPVESAAPAPLVVFFYGGGWRGGAKEKYEFVASALTREGLVVAIADYRVHPQVHFPAFVDDGALAVARAIESAGSGAPVFLAGHSAGAHIAALLANDPRYLERAGVTQGRIAGFVGLSGPYDFLPIESGYLLDVFPAETREDSQPIRYAGPASPPTLLIHGGDDEVVEPGNSERFAAALRAAGVPVDLRVYEDAGHAAVAAALAPGLRFIADTLEDTAGWVRGRADAASSPRVLNDAPEPRLSSPAPAR